MMLSKSTLPSRVTLAARTARSARGAFTLLEVLVVVAIIVMLAGVGGYYVVQRYEESKEKKCVIDANALSAQLDIYKSNNDLESYPTNIQVLSQTQPKGGTPLVPLEKCKDPWGQFYQIQADEVNGKAYVFTTHKGKRLGNMPSQ
jgi:general secretion pathway protein G